METTPINDTESEPVQETSVRRIYRKDYATKEEFLEAQKRKRYLRYKEKYERKCNPKKRGPKPKGIKPVDMQDVKRMKITYTSKLLPIYTERALYTIYSEYFEAATAVMQSFVKLLADDLREGTLLNPIITGEKAMELKDAYLKEREKQAKMHKEVIRRELERQKEYARSELLRAENKQPTETTRKIIEELQQMYQKGD